MRLTDLFEFGGEPQKVTKVAGTKVTVTDPKKPGIETTIDTSKMDIDNTDKTNTVLKPKKPGAGNKHTEQWSTSDGKGDVRTTRGSRISR